MPYIKPIETAAAKGFIQAMSGLSAVMQDAFIQGDCDMRPISFGAGIPDHQMPKEMVGFMQQSSSCSQSPYAKYDLRSEIKESAGTANIAAFHNRHFGSDFTANQAVLTCGSSPVLAACAYVTCEPGSKVLSVHPSYPQMAVPVEKNLASMETTAYLEAGSDGRWSINTDSFKQALDKNRDTPKNGGAAMLYLNFPGNPSGYAPTPDEYVTIVDLLADDIRLRKEQGLESFLILEDIAYATMMHDEKQFCTLHQALNKAASESPEKAELYDAIRQSTVTAHSFSKAFGAAGERIGYAVSSNETLLSTIEDKTLEWSLTPPRMAFAAMAGALEAGSPDPRTMQEYGERLRMLENGLQTLSDGKAVPAKADAGFFCAMSANFLLDKTLTDDEAQRLYERMNAIDDFSLRREFDGALENNTVHSARDAALFLAAATGIITIPIAEKDGCDHQIRWSVGQTDASSIKEALVRISERITSEKSDDDAFVTSIRSRHTSSEDMAIA